MRQTQGKLRQSLRNNRNSPRYDSGLDADLRRQLSNVERRLKVTEDGSKPMLEKETPVSATLLDIFNQDVERVQDFLECCNDDELSIIRRKMKDPQALKSVTVHILTDVDDTTKDLAIDD